MSIDQIILFSLFVGVFVLLLWGRWRYDVVAFSALLIAVALGVVPKENAFSGFGHPATIIVALVLIVSRGLINSGAVDLITRNLIDSGRSVGAHIALMGGVGGIMSAFMNNVAALALLMPVDLQAAKRAGRVAGITLMPLAFGTILGGLVTLIGTPPNIIIAQFREDALGEPYRMFDFFPVGVVCALAGIAFVALIGWRLIPQAKETDESGDTFFELQNYVSELQVSEDSPVIGKTLEDLFEETSEVDVAFLGLVQGNRRLPGRARYTEIRAGDTIIVEAPPDEIDRLKGALKLEYAGEKRHAKADSGDLSLSEVVVQRESTLVGRSALSTRMLRRHSVTLLGVSRQGVQFYERVRRLTIEPGDVLLLLGATSRIQALISSMQLLPLASRGYGVTRHGQAWPAIGLFALAIVLASANLVYLPVALAGVAVLYVLFKIVPVRDVYDQVEWPVVVLLGSMLPLGAALESSGGTALIANGIVTITAGLPAYAVLIVLMVVTMTLSDLLNNTATAVIAAPIAVDVARKLSVSPDPFLMAVAIAASCAFLTPIGHKNNTLIMGPGGYRFGDYWRMGLPLEVIVISVAVPTILVVWPL
ncbi:MAG: SLC13 family permease [Pseudomonadota bacterium]